MDSDITIITNLDFAFPPVDNRDSIVLPHAEFLAAILQGHLGDVDSAGPGIENPATLHTRHLDETVDMNRGWCYPLGTTPCIASMTKI